MTAFLATEGTRSTPLRAGCEARREGLTAECAEAEGKIGSGQT